MLAVTVLAVTALAGCGSSGTPASIAGTTWEGVSVTDQTYGETYYAAALGEQVILTFDKYAVTVTNMNEATDYTMAYNYSDGFVTIVTDSATLSGRVDGNTMNLETYDDGRRVTVVYVRK